MENISEETVGLCFVCMKLLRRRDSEKWLYFHGIVACKEHPGVQKWYEGALEMSQAKLDLYQ